MISLRKHFTHLSKSPMYLGVLLPILLGLLAYTVNWSGSTSANLEERSLSFDPSICDQGIIFVNQNAPGNNDGTDWDNAFSFIQDALVCASQCQNPVEIWVAAGTYFPDESNDGTFEDDPSVSFSLMSGVAIYGGFAGFEGTLDERDPENNITILSGDILQDDGEYDPFFDLDGNPVTDGVDHINRPNSTHVVAARDRVENATLDGFLITGGTAFDGDIDDNGAGIFIQNSSPTITNNIIQANAGEGSGSGIFVTGDSDPTLANLDIESNFAGNFGGGISIVNVNNTLTLNAIAFRGNAASAGGGGLHNRTSTVQVRNSVFTGNLASDGGAIYNQAVDFFTNPANMSITFSTISGNVAERGSAIFNEASLLGVSNSILWDNPNLIVEGSVAHLGIDEFLETVVSFSRNIVEGSGGSDAWDATIGGDGGNNKDEDPLFEVPVSLNIPQPAVDGDVRLTANSPAIDMGLNDSVLDNELDFDGMPRIFGDFVDMGAFEFGSEMEEEEEEEEGTPCDRAQIFVDANAGGNNDGSTWADAFTLLQDALTEACGCEGDVEIWVAAGTYYPDESTDNGDTDSPVATFDVCPSVSLYGGFVGGETSIDQRDIAGNPTILSGDLGQDDNPFDPFVDSDNDPSTATQTDHHVGTQANRVVTFTSEFDPVSNPDADPTAIMDGFTVTGGRGVNRVGEVFDFAQEAETGRGIFISTASPTITNVTVQGNHSSTGGGGISIFGNSGPDISYTNVIGNHAEEEGGGIKILVNQDSAVALFSYMEIRGNCSDQNGGGIFSEASNFELYNSVVSGNTAENRGGGIAIDGGGGFAANNPGVAGRIVNTTITGNSAASGSAAFVRFTFAELANSIIWNNGGTSLGTDEAGIGINSSIVENDTDGQLGTSNKFENPIFTQDIDPANGATDQGDFRQSPESPANNMGSNTELPARFTVDLDGNERIQEETIDFGPYEIPMLEMDTMDMDTMTMDTMMVDTMTMDSSQCLTLVANAGDDQKTCANPTSLNATLPAGATGSWTIIAGDGNGTILDPNDARSEFAGSLDVEYVLLWTIDAPNACAPASDTVEIKLIEFGATEPIIECPPTMTVNCGESMDPFEREDCPHPQAVDFCDPSPELTFEDMGTADFCTGGEISRIWTATNSSGASATCKQKILINPDRQAPTISFTPEVDSLYPNGVIEIACDSFPSLPEMADWVNAQDSCSAEVDIRFEEEVISFGCLENRPDSMRCIWYAVDSCGNESERLELIMVVKDETAPEITCPEDITLDCTAQLDPFLNENLGIATATDDCSEVDVTYMDNNEVDKCEGGVIERMWIATDACGNADSCIQMITIEPDTLSPIIEFLPEFDSITAQGFITLECTDSTDFSDMPNWVTASDNCDESLTINFEDIPMDADCQTDGYFKAMLCTWVATDECGNSSDTLSIEIRFVDNTAPEITCPLVASVECGADLENVELDPFNTLEIFDACDPNPNVTVVDSVDTTTCDGGVIFRTITVTDECGNTNSCQVEIPVTPDTIAPVIEDCPTDLQLSCNPTEFPAPTPDEVLASDNCSSLVTTVNTIQNDTLDCLGTLVYEYVVTDECGNADTCTQTITYQVDDELPEISFENPDEVTVDSEGEDGMDGRVEVVCNPDPSYFDLPAIIASDSCGIADTIFTETITVDGCENHIERTWQVVDECGNISFPIGQDLRYRFDTLAPIIVGCPKDMDLGCNPELLPEVATTPRAIDDCNATVEFLTDTLLTDCTTTITNQWVAIDDCGNVSDTCTQLITFTTDTIAPEFITPIEEFVDLGCNPEAIPEPPVVEATDSCGTVEIFFQTTTEIIDCERIITRTWVAVDACGNEADPLVQFVSYKVDLTPPTIVCPADEDLGCNPDTLPLPALTEVFGRDNCDGGDEGTPPTITVDTVRNDTLGCTGILQYRFTATDLCGNSSSAIQTITYAVDEQAPVVENCPEDIILTDCELELPEVPQVRFRDNCAVDSISFNESEARVEGCMNVITRTWVAVDACGNASDTCEQRIYFQDNNQEITLACAPDTTLMDVCNPIDLPEPMMGEVAVVDSCYGEPFEFNGTLYVLSNIIGDLRDAQAEAALIGGTLVSIDDEAEAAFLENTFGDLQEFWTATSQDAGIPLQGIIELEQQNYEINAEVISTDTAGCEASVTYQYTVLGKCGQTDTCTQVITYKVDNEAPIIVECPADEDLGCNPIELPTPNVEALLATDDCSAEGITEGSTYVLSNTAGTWEEVRAEALALGGDLVAINSAEEQALIEQQFPADGSSDTWYWIGLNDRDQEGTFVWSNGDPLTYTNWRNENEPNNFLGREDEVIINFGGNPGWGDISPNRLRGIIELPTQVSPSDLMVTVDTIQNDTMGCNGILVYEYTVTDPCGNSTSCRQTFTYKVDNEAPIIDCIAEEIDLGCNPPADSIPPMVRPNVSDNCSDVNLIATETKTETDCEVTLERTFIATDACGNADTCMQIIRYSIDTLPPMFVDCQEEIDLGCNPEFIPEPDTPMVVDACGIASLDFVQTESEDGCERIIERTWTATDSCGLTETCVQTLRYCIDTVPPTIQASVDTIVVECESSNPNWNPTDINLAEVISTEDDCGEVTLSMRDSLISSGTCDVDGAVELWQCTVTATDKCGNESEAIFFVKVEDTTPPVIIIDQPELITVSCDSIPELPIVMVDDNCGADVFYDQSFDNQECFGNYDIIRTWTAVDACGNETTTTQTIQVRDEQAPEIEITGRLENAENGGQTIIDCADLDLYIEGNWVSAQDNCDPVPAINRSIDRTGSDGCVNGVADSVTVTWTATDDCGNATAYSHTLVVIDNTAPVLYNLPADTCVTELPSPPAVKADDECTREGLVVEMQQTGPFECDGGTFYERTWTATDACGNATTHTQKIAINDEQAPVIAINTQGFETVRDGQTITIDGVCDNDFGLPELKVVAFDGCGAATVQSVDIQGSTDSLSNAVSVSITAIDICGNTASLSFNVITNCDNAPTDVINANAPELGATISGNKRVSLSLNSQDAPQSRQIVVLRSSDNKNFVPIAEIPVENKTDYSFVDPNPMPGDNFYRILQVDSDDAQQYSNTTLVFVGQAQAALRLFPNPTKDKITVEFKAFAGKQGTLQIYSPLGQIVKEIPFDAFPASATTIELKEYPAGLYRVVITAKDGERSIQPLVIQE